jgi:hypothetical protein
VFRGAPHPPSAELDRIIWPLFHDELIKADLAGVGCVYMRLECEENLFDADLWFEDERLEDAFVPYLRRVILEGGGIGPAGIERAQSSLLKELTSDLVPF